jgi:hypothetical protein
MPVILGISHHSISWGVTINHFSISGNMVPRYLRPVAELASKINGFSCIKLIGALM